MKWLCLFCTTLLLISCWKPYPNREPYQPNTQKVWGSKPVYAAETAAKQIFYQAGKQPLLQAGNIYALGTYIFQVDIGRGIHVINNSVPSNADRIGFITVKGCEQVSIKGNYLYTNSFGDLVTIDVADPANLKEVSRVLDAFPEFRYNYPLIQPEEKGYYTCPRTDSVVVGWVKDSIYSECFRN